MTTERSIIFCGPMVRAILEGRKTQTRRLVKKIPRGCRTIPRGCPYGVTRDLLWVKETFATDRGLLWWRADGEEQPKVGKWSPSIFMPRWASRITLELTAVRLQRVQELSEADAIAEGIVECWPGSWHWEKEVAMRAGANPVEAYRTIWDGLKGEKHPWDSNPWVWVLEFRRLDR